MLGITINNFTQKSGDKLKIYLHLSVQDETRTHTAYRPLPPQSSASTNSATWTYIDRSGAKNGTRTRDPDLGKVVLYQLSYFRIFILQLSRVSFSLFALQSYYLFFICANFLFNIFISILISH